MRSIHSAHLKKENLEKELSGLDGILVAPGFGERGLEGKILAVQYAREKQIPFLGICLGMQMAVIEYARNVLGLSEANTAEMKPDSPHPVINLMEEQKSVTDKGGTMRLGAWKCQLKEGTLAQEVYGESDITERHRHRFEFNNAYLEKMEAAGMKASGINPDTGLVEVVEIPEHPWFIGVQYHPEYKSTVANPHPLFVGFVKAVYTHKQKQTNASLA